MTRTFHPLFGGALLCLLSFIFLVGCGGSAASRGAGSAYEGEASFAGPDSNTGAPAPVNAGPQPAASPVTPPPPASVAQPESAAATPVPPPAAAPSAGDTGGTAASRVAASLAAGAARPAPAPVAECWQPLLLRLQKDPQIKGDVSGYFANLPQYSPDPMGVKVKELFTSAFLRKKKPDSDKPRLPPSRIYRNVVTADTLAKCNAFLARNKPFFDAVEKKYPVPRQTLAALLFVETRLGTFVGKENAFWSLACMAAADTPERMTGGLDGIPLSNQHTPWLKARLTDKSAWAYKELRALLAFCSGQSLDPHAMPGSVYGAIGICQFMPSNLDPYGDDGDGDGVVNLFSEPDAIFSAASYLTKHGWAANLNVDRQRAVLKRYNNLNIYANTILALAETIRTGVLQTAPPDTPARSKKKG